MNFTLNYPSIKLIKKKKEGREREGEMPRAPAFQGKELGPFNWTNSCKYTGNPLKAKDLGGGNA